MIVAKRHNGQKGFTLVELVVVIAVLAILAAMALPKFISTQVQARVASIRGLEGALLSTTSLAHSAAVLAGVDTSASSSIVMEGQTVSLAYGYPTGAAAGIGTAVTLSSGYVATYAAGTATINLPSAMVNCNVTYTQAASAVSPAVIVATVSGC
jgi:MSHA pilin protein MshA